jgi:gamma-glutamyltranspeptidase/glutathione hydrolase
LLQALQVLESADLESLGHNSSAYIHRVAEALKHGFADRAHHMGDPDFVDVPVDRLLSEERVKTIRDAFQPDGTLSAVSYGEPIASPKDAGTQHISVLDASGGAVALTTTINTSFGSGVVAEGTGIILNNEMDDFVAAPGVPNAYGLIGNAANAVEAGKRPLSSMSPTVVLDAEGRVVMVAGASGGSHIISATLQVILSVLEFGMDPQEAVAATRFHHQWQPETLWIEPSVPMDVRLGLEARGHKLYVAPDYASVQVIVRNEETLRGGADPRKGGWPAASHGSR